MTENDTAPLILCAGCSVPLVEMPESGEEWVIQAKTIPCPDGNPACDGHTVERHVFCCRCQVEGKAKAPTEGGIA
jgi:hypothetical protein